MNIIFLDFDGVINSMNSIIYPKEDEGAKERRIKILGDICKKYDCKVVIESSYRDLIDDETLETEVEWIKEYFNLFKKYGIELVGRVPVLESTLPNTEIDKGSEILAYLNMHPEIEHFCVIDDDDLVTIPAREKGDFSKSDLNPVRDYLITPLFYSEKDPNETGLQEKHIEEVGKILQKENNISKRGIRL